MKQIGCIDSFRLCNPNAIEFSRISSYLANGSEIRTSKSRIDHIHLSLPASDLFRVVAAAIDSSASAQVSIHSDHFPTLASISLDSSEQFCNVEYEIESEQRGFDFKDFILDCNTADLCNTPPDNTQVQRMSVLVGPFSM